MKYVILKNPSTGYYHPIVFDRAYDHLTQAVAGLKSLDIIKAVVSSVVGAGFLAYAGNTLTVPPDEKSVSLGIGPSPLDEFILTAFLRHGFSGLELNNLLTYVELERRKGRAVDPAAVLARQTNKL